MLVDRKYLTQQLECLTEEQLQQVNEFIKFLKFKAYSANLKINETQIAEIDREFADEDRQLAEQGMDEYEEVLSSEDS